MIISLALLLVLIGCSKGEQTGTRELSPEADKVKEVLHKNYESVEEKDLDSYLQTLVKASRADTKVELEEHFEKVDISYELEDFKVLEESKEEMVVEAKQKATIIDAPEDEGFQDHLATLEYTFVLEDEAWRIKETEIISTKKLK